MKQLDMMCALTALLVVFIVDISALNILLCFLIKQRKLEVPWAWVLETKPIVNECAYICIYLVNSVQKYICARFISNEFSAYTTDKNRQQPIVNE
jgi:hypothetical protein